METLNLIIGENLNHIRQKRNLSLDDVALMTGVSKSMLAQIERGKSNPTISTLWKISTGLKVPFSSFMEKTEPQYELIDCQSISPITEEDGLMKIYPIFPFSSKNKFEVLNVELKAGCIHLSPSHEAGVEEYIFVTEGTLEVQLDERPIVIKKGSCLKFYANIEHQYKTIGDETCIFQNIIVYHQ